MEERPAFEFKTDTPTDTIFPVFDQNIRNFYNISFHIHLESSYKNKKNKNE